MSETNTNGNISKKTGFMSEFGEEQLNYISEKLSNLLFEAKLLQTLNNTGVFKSSKLWEELNEVLSGKVSSEDGKGLSSNDFTDEEKAKIEQLIADIKTKQKLLTFDSLPMSDSSNPVTSDGVYKADEAIKSLIGQKYTELINRLTEIAQKKVDAADGYGLAEVLYHSSTTDGNYAILSILMDGYISGLRLYDKDQTDKLLSEKQDELTFDTTPTEGSSNPVTSDGIFKFVKENSSGSESYTFDDVPTLGSTNPVTSEGIWNAIDGTKSLIADNDADISELGDEIAKIKDGKVDKINGMGLARIGSYGTSYYIAYQDCDDGTAMNIEVYDTAQTDTAISNAIGDVNIALENIIAKYGLGGDEV